MRGATAATAVEPFSASRQTTTALKQRTADVDTPSLDEREVIATFARRKMITCPAAHNGIGRSVPVSVPERGPKPVIRQSTTTTKSIHNGPEIIDFRPVLESPATLANRRFRPLSHLTVLILLTISAICR